MLGRKVSSDDDIFAAEDDLLARAQAGESASADEQSVPFEALGSQARFDHALYDGAAFGHEGEVHVGSDEEMDFLGIPGLLEPAQMKELLQQRQASRAKAREARGGRRDPDTRRAGRDPRAAGRAAPGAQRPGLRLEPPDRPAARHHPRRAAQGVRRPGGSDRQRRAAAGADRPDPGVGGPQVVVGARASDVSHPTGKACLT